MIKNNIKKIKFKMVDGDQLSISLSFRVNSNFNFNSTQKHKLILMECVGKKFFLPQIPSQKYLKT